MIFRLISAAAIVGAMVASAPPFWLVSPNCSVPVPVVPARLMPVVFAALVGVARSVVEGLLGGTQRRGVLLGQRVRRGADRVRGGGHALPPAPSRVHGAFDAQCETACD